MATTPRAAPRASSPRPPMSAQVGRSLAGVDQASVMGMELVAGILLYAGLGWLADEWLGTGPWLLVLGALLGNATGLYLVWLRSGRMDAAERADRAAGGDRVGHGPVGEAGDDGR